jgi:pyridoxamine 5'-phosphate oxidase family protein
VAFNDDEIAYLATQGIARLATLGPGEQPDAVPVAFEFDRSVFWIGGPGKSFLATRKVRNVQPGRAKVAPVIDDLGSLDPFIARGVRVYGEAESPVERVGMVGPGFSTFGSFRPSRGVGTWQASRWAPAGTTQSEPSTAGPDDPLLEGGCRSGER